MASEDPGPAQRNLTSPSISKAELQKRLSEDGINPNCGDEEKLFYVWRLFQQTEADLQQSVRSEEKLRQSQAEEMEEVENYVEHIRNLSDERETLIQELETENDQLKADIEQLKQQSQAGGMEETVEMLTQQGLVEITTASFTEQIAFLLVERARLLDELEAEQNKSINSGIETPTPETSQLRSVEEERDDLKHRHEEVSLENGRLKEEGEKLKHEGEALKREGEALKREGEQLKQQLDQLNRDVEELRQDREDLSEQLTEHRKAEAHLKLVHDEEVTTLMEENDKCEEDLAELRLKISNLESELQEVKNQQRKEQEEKGSVNKDKEESATATKSTVLTNRPPSPARTNSDLALRKVIVEKTQIESEIVSLRSQLKPLENENESLKEKIDELEGEVEESRMMNHTLQMKNKSLQNELQDKDNNDDVLQRKVDLLKRQRSEVEGELSSRQEEIAALQTDHQQQQHQLQTRYEEISTKMQDLQTEFASKQNKLNAQISELQRTVDSLTSEKEGLESTVSGLTSELEGLRACSQEDVKAQTSKLEAVIKERQKLYGQLQETQKELREKVSQEQSLVREKESVEKSMKTTETRLSQDNEDLKAKLQMSLSELTKSRASVDQLTSEKAGLDRQLRQVQNTAEDNKSDFESTVENLQSKVKSLESQKKTLQEDLFSSQDEMQKTQEHYEQAIKKLTSDKSSVERDLNDKLQERLANEETLNKQKLQLEKSKADLQISLENNTSTVVGLQKTLDSVYHERDGLQQKLTSLEDTLQQEKVEKLKQLEAMQKERDSYKESIDNIQTSLQEDGKEKNKLIAELQADRDQLKREVDKFTKSARYEGEERQQYLEKIRSMEASSKQLEQDNRELAHQLSEKLVQCQHLDDQMRKEKNRQIEKSDKSHEEVERLHVEIDSANERIRQLREEAQTKQSHINRLEMEAVSQEPDDGSEDSDPKAKHETAIHKMELEINDLKLHHRKELDSFSEKMDSAQRELKELVHQLREKEQEIIGYEHEASRAKTVSERLDTQLQTEIKHRAELENKNTTLEHDISKLWVQVKSLMEKLNNLENSKKSLEEELHRKSHLSKESSEYHTKKLASQETELTSLRHRAELAENKVDKLKSDLTEAVVKLQATEKQMFENAIAKAGYQDKQGEITDIRRSLHETQIQRTILEQTVHELKQQISILKQRESKVLEHNRELQHMMIDMESKVSDMRERAQAASEQPCDPDSESQEESQKSESGKRSLAEQISKLRREIEKLQMELTIAHEKRDIWERRYEDRKVRTKAKLLKAREFYTNERNKLKDQLGKISDDLVMTRSTLNKELEWRNKIDDSHKRLLTEKRDLLTQLAESEESCRDLTRHLSLTETRLTYQEGENNHLQQRIEALTQQKLALDKNIKEYQIEKHQQILSRALSPDPHLQSLTAGTSGLGNSMDSSWDPDHLAESVSRLPSMPQDQHINGFFSRGLHRGGIEFSGSERSYDFNHEFDA